MINYKLGSNASPHVQLFIKIRDSFISLYSSTAPKVPLTHTQTKLRKAHPHISGDTQIDLVARILVLEQERKTRNDK